MKILRNTFKLTEGSCKTMYQKIIEILYDITFYAICILIVVWINNPEFEGSKWLLFSFCALNFFSARYKSTLINELENKLKELNDQTLEVLKACDKVSEEQIKSYRNRNIARKVGWISSLVTLGGLIFTIAGSFIAPVVGMIFAGITLGSYTIGLLPGFFTAHAFTRDINKKNKIMEKHQKEAEELEEQIQLILEKNNVLNQDLQEAKNKVVDAKEKVSKAKSKVSETKRKTASKAPTTTKKKTNIETTKR